MKRKQIAGMNQNYRQYSYQYFLESMQMAGYESVELWLGAPHVWVDSKGWNQAKTIAKETRRAGLEIVSVTTPSGGAFQYQYAAQESFHRKRSIEYFQNGVHMTAELAAPIMTVNSGWGYWTDEETDAFARSVEILGAVCRTAEQDGVTIALESLTQKESLIGYRIDQIEKLVSAINSPALKVMVDLDATWYSGETAQQWFDRFGENLIHYHFQDGDRMLPSDGHYIWGNGEFCLEEEIRCLERNGYSGILTQEICNSLDPRADEIRNMQVLEGFLED